MEGFYRQNLGRKRKQQRKGKVFFRQGHVFLAEGKKGSHQADASLVSVRKFQTGWFKVMFLEGE